MVLQQITRILPLVCILVLSWPAENALAQTSCSDPASTMLWEVTGAGLDTQGVSVNLLGSIHVGRADFYPLADEIENRFKAADALVFEVDPRILADPQTALTIQQRGTLPAGQQIDQVVSADTMDMLSGVLGKLQIPAQLVSNLRPWMVGLMLSSIQVQTLGYNAQYGIENYLMRDMPLGSRILQLETLDSQISMLETLDQEIFLRYSLLDFEQTSALMMELVDAWLCGDHAALGEVLFSANAAPADFDDEERIQFDALTNRIFDERNLTMANGVEQFIKTGTGSYFVVVGAGHLIGEGSVVDLLQQRGYTVTPVRQSR